jgi:hypothetical protein
MNAVRSVDEETSLDGAFTSDPKQELKNVC